MAPLVSPGKMANPSARSFPEAAPYRACASRTAPTDHGTAVAKIRHMLRDFLFAYRLLKKSPISTAVIIIALPLGIGANASTFIGVNAILLHPFAYPHLDRIV